MARAAEGTTRKLPSGRWQARFTYPDGVRRPAPTTFQTKRDATAWIAQQRADVSRGLWTPETATKTNTQRPQTLSEYGRDWVANRTVRGRPIAVRTRQGYEDLLRLYVDPTIGTTPVSSLTKTQLGKWYRDLPTDKATTRARVYALVRSILATAVEDDDLLVKNPLHVRGAAHVDRTHEVVILTPAEVRTLADAMPARLRLMVLLAATCNLRFGEVTELRRSDFDMAEAVVHVRRAVIYSKGEFTVKQPKSRASIRSNALPPFLLPLVREHLMQHCAPGMHGLLFPSAGDDTRHLHATTVARHFKKAAQIIERPGLHFHDLRHLAATTTTLVGGSEAEVMRRTGHSTRTAHDLYQHASAERDRELAQRISELYG